MTLHRFIATARSNFVELEDEHFPCIVESLDVARWFAAGICERNGWVLLDVRPETSEHNIPKLAPLRWERNERLLADIERRCRAHA